MDSFDKIYLRNHLTKDHLLSVFLYLLEVRHLCVTFWRASLPLSHWTTQTLPCSTSQVSHFRLRANVSFLPNPHSLTYINSRPPPTQSLLTYSHQLSTFNSESPSPQSQARQTISINLRHEVHGSHLHCHGHHHHGHPAGQPQGHHAGRHQPLRSQRLPALP
jgi:hypothetical protein